MSKSDVIALSEHKLYESELYILGEISDDFAYFGRSSEDLIPSKYGSVPGHCGVALFWRKSMSAMIKPMDNLGTDRICVVKLCNVSGNSNVYIIAVYLPHSKCQIADFQSQMDHLQSVIDVCSRDGVVLIAGDWNAHFGDEYGDRASGVTSTNGKIAMNAIQQHDMYVVDLDSSCQGPTYTYCGENGSVSYIDHFVMPTRFKDKCIVCKVFDDKTENTSDHLALYVELSTNLVELIPGNSNKQSTSWDRVYKLGVESVYMTPLEYELGRYLSSTEYPQAAPSDWTTLDIDNVYNDLVSVIKYVDAHLPKQGNKKSLKHYWSRTLTQMVRDKKCAWKQWVIHGRPRNPENPLWLRYKETKRILRREIRRQEGEADQRFVIEIEEAGDISQKQFWRLINRRRGSRGPSVRPFQKTDGSILTDMDDIREAWATYYEELYTPSNNGYDQDFKNLVEGEIGNVNLTPCDDTLLLKAPISEDEVLKVIKKVKNKKAAGPDGVQAEHIKLGGSHLLRALTDLFNAMVAREHRPALMKRGLIVPIPKGRKDSSIPDNNRGITLASVIGKIYDSVLVARSGEWLHGVIDDLQGANHKNCSCTHTAMLLREMIAYGRESDRTVYTALLDVRKAFDQVWIDGLFYKLKHNGMDPKLWRILRNAYSNFQCSVLVAGGTSRQFQPEQGIHQGDVWSMPLYCVFNNDMIKELKSSIHGTRLRAINCTCPTFVDDLSIVAWSKFALNFLLSVAFRYSRVWRFQFGAIKSFLLIFGKDQFPDVKVKLGNDVIKASDTHMHVGIPLCTSKASERKAIQDRSSACRQTLFTIKGVTPVPQMLNPITMSKLYWSLCVTKLTYGIEVWPIGRIGMDALEKVHNQCAKSIQGLPVQTSDPACHATLGWKTMEAHCDLYILMFLWKLIALPVSCIYNQLVIDRVTYFRFRRVKDTSPFSPIYNMYQTAIRYGLSSYVHDMLDTGVVHSRNKWFSIVNSAITNDQAARWSMTCMLYKRLNNLLLYVPIHARLQWWSVCKFSPMLTRKCKTLIRLLVGEHTLGCGKGKHIYKTKLCQLCDSYVEETIPHFLLQCSGLQRQRVPLLAGIRTTMPPAMISTVDNMTDVKQSQFLLGEMGRTFVAEWCDIHRGIIDLVHGLYQAREAILLNYYAK